MVSTISELNSSMLNKNWQFLLWRVVSKGKRYLETGSDAFSILLVDTVSNTGNQAFKLFLFQYGKVGQVQICF